MSIFLQDWSLAQSNDPPWWAFLAFFIALLTVGLVGRRMDAASFRRLIDRDPAARGLGLLAVAFGAGLGWLLLAGPLADAMAGRQRLLVQRGVVALATLFAYLGLILLALGRRAVPIVVDRHPGGLTRGQAIAVGVGLVLCLGAELAYHQALIRMGYAEGW